MNWQRLYATFQIKILVGSIAIGSGICWGVAINALSQFVFGLDKCSALYWIGIPSSILITIISFLCLPKALMNTGTLSDDPEKFGPWFK